MNREKTSKTKEKDRESLTEKEYRDHKEKSRKDAETY